MKKKLLVLVAMLLCIVTVLSACGEAVKFKKIVADEYVDQNPTLTKAEAVSLTGSVVGSQGDLLYFAGMNDDGKYVQSVYNIAENKTVWTGTESETTDYNVSLKDGYYDDVAWFLVSVTTEGEDEDTTIHEIYDQKGNKVTSFDDQDVAEPNWFLDLIVIDTKVYRIAEDGTIAEAFEISALRALPTVAIKAGDYYLALGSDYTISTYDAELNLTGYCQAPAYAYGVRTMVLNNGNVLVQYKVAATWDAEDYSYIGGEGEKVILTSLLINPKNGKAKELDLDFVLITGTSRAEGGMEFVDFDVLNEKIENVALVSYIVDERVVGSTSLGEEAAFSTNTSWIWLSNKGKDKGALDATVIGQATLPYAVCENRWMVYTLTGEMYLIDEKGKTVAEISNVDEFNSAYLIADGKLFNMDGEMVYDYEKADLEFYDNETTNRGVFFSNEDSVITLYVNGESKTIIAKDADRRLLTVRDSFFVVEDNTGDDTKYEIYNDVGTLLYTVEKASGSVGSVYTASNNALVIMGLESDGEDVVIRLAV